MVEDLLNARQIIPDSTSYVGTMGDCRENGEQLRAEALRRGLALAQTVIFLGDGAAWIWENARLFFPSAIQILDFYHAVEHLGVLARALYGEGNSAPHSKPSGPPNSKLATCKASSAKPHDSSPQALNSTNSARKSPTSPPTLSEPATATSAAKDTSLAAK